METITGNEFSVLQEIGNLSKEGMIIYNLRAKKVVYCNAPATDLTGLRTNATQTDVESVLEMVVPADREYLKEKYLGVGNHDVTPEVEFRIRKKNNEEKILCCNAYLVLERSHVVLGVSDISKPKEHENYLVEFGARKNTLLDTLVHHISGALNLMQHLTAQAEKHVGESENVNVKTYLNLVNRNSQESIEMINDLMRDEHTQSPKIQVKTARIDLVEKIGFIHKQLQQRYGERKFDYRYPNREVFVTTDEVKLLQVVNNLTSNAIKFTHETEVISIIIDENQDEVIIAVADRGIGIPEQLKPFLFDRHGGAGRTGLNGERSMGMGLSICKNLVQLLQGRIWFESEEGKGSTFYISLPKNL